MKPIVIEKTFRCSLQAAWEAWTIPQSLEKWLAPLAKVDLIRGGAYELFGEPANPEVNSTLGCVFTQITPGSFLSFTWRGPEQFAHLMNKEPFPTSGKIFFGEIAPNLVCIRLEHAGWQNGSTWKSARDWQQKAWNKAFAKLTEFLQPGTSAG